MIRQEGISRSVKSYIESIGVYLPSKKVSTAEILDGCVNHIRLPLQRLTGIQCRHSAGESEFSIDLAIKSLDDCLQRSSFQPHEVDLLMCANISRYDRPSTVAYEPSTAIALKKKFGLSRALAVDVSNACAGMWTAVYIADAMIRSGSIENALIVSGEYISHLTDTAQREIMDAMDPQIASLTLGDAGVTIAMRPSPSPQVGFHDIEIFTLSQYSRYCVAKPTDQPHGGAAMRTDPIKITSAAVPHFATLADRMLARNGWQMKQVEHIVPHQTSRLTMRSALKEIGLRYGEDLATKLIDNLSERGNTATTAHFLALRDSMVDGRIRTGDDILFMISGSGQTLGTALYTCDDLPDRTRSDNGASRATREASAAIDLGATLPVPIEIESIGFADPKDPTKANTLEMLQAASLRCLEQSARSKAELSALISVGVYRTEYLTEPALAALLAGDLELYGDGDADHEKTPLAFDLPNGSVGFLNACHVVSELARVGAMDRAMVVASEIENNAAGEAEGLVGVKEMASAVVLQPSSNGESGFQAFGFYDFPEYSDVSVVAAKWNEQGRISLDIERKQEMLAAYLECTLEGMRRFLREHGLEISDIALLLPPQNSHEFVQELISKSGFPKERTVDLSPSSNDLDLSTSTTPLAIHAARQQGLAKSGDLGLVVNVGSGVQVACALYQF